MVAENSWPKSHFILCCFLYPVYFDTTPNTQHVGVRLKNIVKWRFWFQEGVAITSLNWRKKARDSNENKSDGRNPLMIHTGAVSLMASLVLVPSISTWSHLEEVYWMRHQTRFLFHFISYLFAVQKFCVFFLRFREERETNKEWDEKK